MLPEPLYRAAEVRELDRIAIEEQGLPGIVLMKRAGRACFQALLQHWPEPERLLVFCGGGNNGGDGFVIAGLGAARNIPVRLWMLGDQQRLRGDARLAWQWAGEQGVVMEPFAPAALPDEGASGQGVIVDAMLGTGFQGEVRPAFAAAMEWINASGLPVLAVDLPSGLNADTGEWSRPGVRADCTVSFIGLKRGLFTHQGPDCCGRIHFDSLGVTVPDAPAVRASARLLNLHRLRPLLPSRSRTAHKGRFGHLLVVGGGPGMAGAVAMAGMAAARLGCGLVSVATRSDHVAPVLALRPELMVHGVDEGSALQSLLDRCSAVVIGPGLGRDAWAEQMLQQVTDRDLPTVVDADALQLLVAGEVIEKKQLPRGSWVLTPHPGEAATLLGREVAAVQRDRFAAVAELQRSYGGVVILKGAGSLVCLAKARGKVAKVDGERDGQALLICPYGNPGMASGGMGDVLSGILGGLMAQGVEPGRAASLGVCLHGRSADLAAAEGGEHGLLATDLLPWLRRLLNDQTAELCG